MTNDVVEEIEKLLAEATPGEWKLWNGYGPDPDGNMRIARIGSDDVDDGLFAGSYRGERDIAGRREDFELIVAMKNAMPLILERLRRAEKVEKAAREYVEAQNHFSEGGSLTPLVNVARRALDAALREGEGATGPEAPR